MKKTIVAIGGGEIGRIKIHEDGRQEQKPIETMIIDRKIIELTGKKQPKLVFIGAASGDDPRYFKAVSDHFGGRLNCHTENLVLTDLTKRPNTEDIRKIILGADIIYVGGGCVSRLMNALKESGADKVLIEAYNHGIIMSGNSAGGCVWFESYDNEEEDDFNKDNLETLKTKPALGIVRGYFVPHWNTKSETEDHEGSVSRKTIKQMLNKECKWGYAVDEGAAIMVQSDGNNQIMTEIISKPGAGVYKLNQDVQNIRPDNNMQR